MREVIKVFFDSLMNSYATYYIVYKLMNSKMSFNDKKLILIFLVHTIFITFCYFLTDNVIRIVIIYVIMMLFIKILFNRDFIKCMLCSFITYIYIFISEILFMLIVLKLFHIDIVGFKKYFFADIITNVSISLFMILLINVKPITNFLSNLVVNINLTKKKKMILMSLLTFVVISSILYCIYFEISPIYTLVLNLALILVYSSLTIMLFKENNDKVKIETKYESMVTTSEKYEKVIEDLRMNNHENKNNLIVLRGMIRKTNKKAMEYINGLIDEEIKEDKSLLWKTRNIPSGGLQGIIYQKLLEIKDKKIEYHLSVDKNIDKKRIEKLSAKTNKDLSTIVGIFLDNAIQEVDKIQEKNIGIYLYQEKNEFIITISNTYRGRINLEKMSEKGYTTKGEGHGYGLSLVEEIIKKHSNFKNERTIRGNAFVQKLIIKLRKQRSTSESTKKKSNKEEIQG